MKKNIISGAITLTLLFLINFLLCRFLKLKFIELSFMTGLMFTIIIGFFSSEGGITTEITNFNNKRLMESQSRTKDHFVKFYVNTPFIVSLAYTLIAAIASIIIYWEYFF